MTPQLNPRAIAILSFWFGPDPNQAQEKWFRHDDAFDKRIVELFGADYECACTGAYDGWQACAQDALALVILLDQFPRNMFRGTARAFDTDAKALLAAEAAVTQGFDQRMPPVQRIFFYLPFEHAEDIAAQERSLALTAALAQAGFPDFATYAEQHAAIVRRFGRFPHRNAALGRASTPEEMGYLQENPAPFGS